jgi:hypothetical protein
MTLVRRVIVWLGGNALVLRGLPPPFCPVRPGGIRREPQPDHRGNLPPDWSARVPLPAGLPVPVVFVTAGLALAFRTKPGTEAQS